MKAFVAATFFVVLALPVRAAAQNTFCATAAACTTGISVTSATTIVGIGVTMLTRIRKRKIAALDLYVRLNRVAVFGALTIGGGDVLHDLADLAAVRDEDFADFVARLRERRAQLRAGFDGSRPPGYLGALVLAATEE